MKRLKSLLPWSWTEREQGSNARPVSLLRSSAPSLFNWFEEQFNEMNRLMQSFFEESGVKEFTWRPSCQIQESDNEYSIKVDLPGVTEKTLKVELRDDNVLYIQAERRVEQEQHPNAQTHLSELAYGLFTRAFTLPSDADVNNISAELKNGVLTISVPRSRTQANTRTIEVRRVS
ncbi:MAG: Hsp20/alpha crystallin family protein [Deltaproteobacteria bacterium]|nr:Hsp20/alpha crystallin family protein [Deltaproteobacteria bacterium]